jgi:Alginate export
MLKGICGSLLAVAFLVFGATCGHAADYPSPAPSSAVASGTAASAPAGQNSFLDALTNGTPLLDMRYRFEDVDQNGLSHAALANTLRTRAGYATGTFDNFKGMFQVQNVLPIGDELYNDGVNKMTKLPLVADPRQTLQLYQANVTWSGVPQTDLTFGRQAYNLDNQRWVGIADWRQLGQTFDSIAVRNKTIPNLDVFYSYIFHVNRVFGPNANTTAPGEYDMHSHLLNASYTGLPGIKLTGYTYLLDISNSGVNSTDTFGGRFEGKHSIVGDFNGLFNAEYAHQVSAFNNPANYGFDYYLVEPGVTWGPLMGKVGYEVMEGNGTKALQTPLDTGHAFNGWAEKFLVTPTNGLDTVYVSTSYTTKPYTDWLGSTVVKFIWYDFNSNTGGLHDGNEYDAWVGQDFYKYFNVGLEYADFRADQLSTVTNTQKIVLQLQAKY